MPTRVMKYQIVKPMNCDWKLLNRHLLDLQQEAHQILNKTIQLCWEWQGFCSEYKAKYDIYPVDKDIFHLTLAGYVNRMLRLQFPKSNSNNLGTSRIKAINRWHTDLKDVKSGQKSIASFKADVPIDLHYLSIKLHKEKDCYYADLSLISNIYKKELGRESGKLLVLLKSGDEVSRDILRNCLDGIYKIRASDISHKKNKWFLNLHYNYEETNKSLDKDRILGIDMGIAYPVYMSVYNTQITSYIEGGEIERFHKQVEKRSAEFQRQGKYCGNGRIGHGVKTRLKPLSFATDKIANFRETTNHKYSKYIVDFAVKNNCGNIQMEDLTGIKNERIFLRNWTYFDLQKKIRYKAEENGINVLLIKPHYTSQRCSQCGDIDKKSRITQENFTCISCGYQTNADHNASINISTPNIENIINDFMSLKID
ncbi:MAG: transposase [Peptostreptococcaceae bacterium]|nr:transposase [Peptostreptococcaceae bacterium]